MAAEAPLQTIFAKWRQYYGDRRFGILLVILIVLLAGSPVLFGFGLSADWFDGLVALVLLASIHSLCFDRRERVFALVLGTSTMVFYLGGHASSGSPSASILLLGHLCGVSFFFGTAGLIVKSVLNSPSLTLDSILGAICGYLFIGLAWAMCYAMVEAFQPGSFEIAPSLRGGRDALQPLVTVYYSFMTLTTVGYGDITPISPTTRTLAWIEAISGQFYLAIIVAGLVSMLAAKRAKLSPETRTNPPKHFS